jgi:hypothetical protein
MLSRNPLITLIFLQILTQSRYRPDWKSRSDLRPMKLLAKYELERFHSAWKRSSDITGLRLIAISYTRIAGGRRSAQKATLPAT